ncbi:MAG: cytochrome c oxidase subunit II [bacterium]
MRAYDFPLFPEQASTMAPQVDYLYFFLIAVSLFFCLIIAGTLIGFSIKFRRTPTNRIGHRIHGSTLLEVAWSIIPFGITMVIFFWGAWLFFAQARPPDNAHEVFVVGKQWMWKLQHMEGRREINELHVPVGQSVRLTMTSEDVIHSFYVPAFRTKFDVLPGRYTTAWFNATKPGEYHLFCAEYCGTQHAGMIGKVVVMEPAAFQNWLSEPPPIVSMVENVAAPSSGGAPLSPVAAGEALFTQKACLTCHQPQGGALGPSLVNVYGSTVKLADGSTVTADDAYIRESILNSASKIVAGFQPVMPTFQGQLTEEQVMQLIQYIKSLKTTPPAGQAQNPPAAADSAS